MSFGSSQQERLILRSVSSIRNSVPESDQSIPARLRGGKKEAPYELEQLDSLSNRQTAPGCNRKFDQIAL